MRTVDHSADENVTRRQPSMLLRTARYVVLAALLLLSLGTFRFYPGMVEIHEGWMTLSVLLAVTVYARDRFRQGFIVSLLELYIIALIVLMPVLQGVMAWWEFGQPIAYGALSGRHFVLTLGAVYLLTALRRRYVTLDEVHDVLITLSWILLLLYVAAYYGLNPAHFTDYGLSFVARRSDGDYFFKFDVMLLLYGFFYHLFKGFRSRRIAAYVLSLPFAMYFLLIQQGRALFIAVLSTCLILIIRWSSSNRLAILLPKIVTAVLVLTFALYAVKSDHVASFGHRLNDALTVILTGELSDDYSANVRIISSRKVMPYIEKHWLLGNGNLSYQWNDGYKSVFGYFYVSDIGLIGVLYSYGILGTLILSIQFWLAKRYGRRAPVAPMVDATIGMTLFIAINSVVTGLFAFNPSVYLLFITILYAAAIGFPVKRAEIPALRHMGDTYPA